MRNTKRGDMCCTSAALTHNNSMENVLYSDRYGLRWVSVSSFWVNAAVLCGLTVVGDFRGSPSANFTAGRAKAFWAPLENWETFSEGEGWALSPTASPTFCPAWKASLPETHHLTPSVCCWETWLKEARRTHTQPKPINDSHNPPRYCICPCSLGAQSECCRPLIFVW